MKARSVVFQHLQRPTTIFGLPPKMMAINMAVAFLANLFMLLVGAVALSFITSGLLFVIGLAFIYRLSRNDHHIENVALGSLRFWGLGGARRWLLAGGGGEPARGSRA